MKNRQPLSLAWLARPTATRTPRSALPVSLFAVAAGASLGCSEEFSACIREYTTCVEKCPSAEQQQQNISTAEAEYNACIEACPNAGPGSTPAQIDAALACARRCFDRRTAALEAATQCRDVCIDEFTSCVSDLTTCDDPTSTQLLRQVSVADWSKHMSEPLDDANHTMVACIDHFAPGTAAGEELVGAMDAYNDVLGSAVNFLPDWQPHAPKSVIFSLPTAFSSFDYVDNANDPIPHACHPDNTTLCGDVGPLDGFTLNTCRSAADGQWSGSGDTQHFALTVNGACYNHFQNPASSNYPPSSGIQHELGHAAGMNHQESWPAADLQYISTMQGNLTRLSAYDVSFLREFYPENTGGLNYRRYVASSKIRINFDLAQNPASEIDGTFADKNPARVYLVGDAVYDCATQQPAAFRAAWFNTGTIDEEADYCMTNELRIEDRSTAREVLLRRWHAANMPAASQDQWTGAAAATATDFTGLPLGVMHDLVFEVDAYGPSNDWSEVRAPIRVYSSSSCTPPAPPPAVAPPIQRVAPGVYEVDRNFAAQLAADPPRLLRGARLAPERVRAGGTGLRIVTLPADSVAAALGAKQGDVVWRAAGRPVTGADMLTLLIKRLTNTGSVDVIVLRNQVSRRLTYRLR